MKQIVYQSGPSLCVTVPADFAKRVGVKRGQSVNVFVNIESGEITYKFEGAYQLPLSDTFLLRFKKLKIRTSGFAGEP